MIMAFLVWLILIVIVLNKSDKEVNNLNIVDWNDNGINGRWSHLDQLRENNHVTFLIEHKLFPCELYKLSDDKRYSVFVLY